MRLTTTDAALIAAASSARPGPTTLSPTSPGSGSNVGPSSAASSTNTSEPHKSPGQHQWPSYGTPHGPFIVLLGRTAPTRRMIASRPRKMAHDVDQGTRDALGVTGVVPCESTFRRTLQNLDADASMTRPAPGPGGAPHRLPARGRGGQPAQRGNDHRPGHQHRRRLPPLGLTIASIRVAHNQVRLMTDLAGKVLIDRNSRAEGTFP
jgi:hypothetical protein